MHLLRFFSSPRARLVKPAPHSVVTLRHKTPAVGIVNARALTFIGCMMALPMSALGSDLQPAESAAPAVKEPTATQRGLAMGARMVLVDLVNKDTGEAGGGEGVAGEAFV